MQDTKLIPYINFNGNCAEAMNFYQSILGGKLETSKFGDTPMPVEEKYKDLIIHATLSNENIVFNASDCLPNMAVEFGTNISLCIVGKDEAVLTKYFNGLAEGGMVNMPLNQQFWGDTFGMLTDKFGIKWMVNIVKNQH
jgi:PhnB protein